MACGCSGSKQGAGSQDAAAAASAPKVPTSGPQAPGYYFAGPQKREEQVERESGQ